ncbi:MAG: glutathione S-transferase family protein [Formosimonas sp.]
MYQLYIGNKNYSSWSLRPWVLMTHFGIAFTEKLVPLTGAGTHTAYSPNGLVPCLHDDGFQVWDTLAIAEYLHDAHPELNIWPTDAKARARARSIAAEMHSGFGALRSAMPMIIKLRLKGKNPSADVAADIARIEAIFTDTRREFAGDLPYLFGAFSAADAMFAPVVWRLTTYNVPLSAAAQSYVDTMLAHPAMQAWQAGALAETEVMPYDATVLEPYGGIRT